MRINTKPGLILRDLRWKTKPGLATPPHSHASRGPRFPERDDIDGLRRPHVGFGVLERHLLHLIFELQLSFLEGNFFDLLGGGKEVSFC